MKAKDILVKARRTANKVGFSLKKNSPEILIVAGVVGVVVTTVTACKATTKLEKTLDEQKGEIEKVKDEHPDKDGEYKKELTVAYAKAGVEVARLYAPSVAIGVASITSILASNNILRKRNVALAAAYATVDKGFKEYRQRVVERYGADVDQELKYDIHKEKIESKDENGKKKKEEIRVAKLGSDYAKVFDESNKYWEDDSSYNELFLRSEQCHLNNLLHARGHVFLNEVYDRLGFDRIPEGQFIGWEDDETNPNIDSYIEFKVLDVYTDTETGMKKGILLDFNYDGDILDSLNKKKKEKKEKKGVA